jgi:nucleoside-diphosphate-sugar epimerase
MTMQYVVLGAQTALGQALLARLLAWLDSRASDAPGASILGVDLHAQAGLLVDDRLAYVVGDYLQPRFLFRAASGQIDVVFMLEPILAAQDQPADADGLMMVLARGLDATRTLLDTAVTLRQPPRVILPMPGAGMDAPGFDDLGARPCEAVLQTARHCGVLMLDVVRGVTLNAETCDRLACAMIAAL